MSNGSIDDERKGSTGNDQYSQGLIHSLMGSCPGVKPEVTTQSADEQIILVPYERRNEKGKRVRIG